MDKNYMYGLVAAPVRRLGVVGVGLACAVLWLSSATLARAETPTAVTPLDQIYPAGSIKSEPAAAAALAQAAEDRRVLATQYVLDQRECYARFLVSKCLEAAKDRKRAAEKSIKQVEIEANTYRRQAQVDDRDQSLADQHARDEAESARRVQQQKERQAATARHTDESDAKRNQVQQRVDQNLDPDARIRAHEARVAQQQAEDAARVPEREANAAARQQRIKDAEQHRQEVERKKQESERERAEKKRSSQP